MIKKYCDKCEKEIIEPGFTEAKGEFMQPFGKLTLENVNTFEEEMPELLFCKSCYNIIIEFLEND